MENFTPDFFSKYDSDTIDELLGLNVYRIERELLEKAKELNPNGNMTTWGATLHHGNQTWLGLAPSTLQTPYAELKKMYDLLAPLSNSHFVDLGAGYGRLAVVLHAFDPSLSFTGLEFVKERVAHGGDKLKELGILQAKLLEQDLTAPDFKLPRAEYYFIYDYGQVAHIRKTLKQLEDMADQKNFKVIARGKGVRSIIENEHPWLSQVYSPHHEENFSIYSMSLEGSLFPDVPEGPEPF